MKEKYCLLNKVYFIILKIFILKTIRRVKLFLILTQKTTREDVCHYVLFIIHVYVKHSCPSGLRGPSQERLSKDAWVRIPPDAFLLFTLFLYYMTNSINYKKTGLFIDTKETKDISSFLTSFS